MRLISLKIENFRVLRDVQLNFTDQVIGLIGRNGSGKSSIIEAIAWALYGNQAARSGKGEIKSSFAKENDTCRVSLEFAIHLEKYKVVRQLVGRGERAEVQLYRGERSESVGVSETKGYIGELLGLDWHGFLTSFLARQQELNALTDLQPAKRKDHLAGMLGIERLDRAIKKVKEENRISQAQAELIQSQLHEKTTTEDQIKQLTGEADKLMPELTTAENSLKKAEKEFGEATAELKEIQEKHTKYEKMSAEIEAHEKTKRTLQARVTELTDELRLLNEGQERLAVLSEQLKEIVSLEESVDRLKQSASSLELKRKLEEDIESISKELIVFRDRLKEVESELEDIDAVLRKIPEDIDHSVTESRKLLEQEREKYATVVAELKSLIKQQEKLKSQISQIDLLGPESVCDRCHRPLGTDIEQIKIHFEAELEQLNKNGLGLEEQRERLTVSGKEISKRLQQFESEREIRKERLQKQKQLSHEKNELSVKVNRQEERRKLIKSDLERFGELSFDPRQLAQLQAKLAGLQILRTEKERLEGRLTRLIVAESEKKKASSQLAEEGDILKSLNEATEKLQFSTELYQSIVARHARTQQNRDSSRSVFTNLQQKIELVRTELRGKQELMEKLTLAEKQLEDIQVSHFHGVKLASLFSDFRGELISRIRPTLSDISSRLMSEMTDGRYPLVELDEKYDLQVMDNGVFYGVDRFSGGEKDLANLCLRLAISQALTQSAGLDRSFIILDEVFGSQDDGRKELILHALSRLKEHFPQILLITHIEDIRERVETLIEVTPTGLGWSGVKVNAG